MAKTNCVKCGKEMKIEATCMDCTLKEIEENSGSSPCDFCGKELLGRSADQEITLFYKDANKDYNFCSKDCLKKFIEKLK